MDYTNDTEIINRANELVTGNLSGVCGQNCPMLCCDPVVAISFLPKNLFKESENFHEVNTRMQKHIDTFVDQKTSDGKECFSFRHIYIDDIRGEFAGLTEEQIKANILEVVKKPIEEKELAEMVTKAKVYLREQQLALILGFSCLRLDSKNSLCTVYNERPDICQKFTCYQLQKKFGKKQKKDLLEYLTIKKSQRENLKTGGTDIISAIQLYYLRSKQSY
ncbi:MAG: YkgJ family cysteine cluster protein [Leptospiraceae bacterium]|nr:YkgJ family cysteine cluster protein [Leptospiraceae bacterium]MCP5496577.1 YkgJ family cysteine cluster protein [Leptospiraceae bacterium]